MNIYIVGHKSPDLDAIASPYIYAEYLNKVKRYKNANIMPVAADTPNKETQFVFNKFNIDLPKTISQVKIEENDKFILMDHNEEAQRVEEVDNSKVLEIVDHHKININFTTPLKIDVRPLGSTSTILYQIAEESNTELSTKSKGLILSAIISDTVGLKSPTTTGLDSTIAENLTKNLNIDFEKYTFEIFKAKSSIKGLSVEDILKKDYKIFNFAGTKVFIGVIETVEQDTILEMKENILSSINELKSIEGVSHAYFVVQDILAVNSKVIYETHEEGKVLEKAFTTKANQNIADIGPKLSRKKEIAPAIENTIVAFN